MSNPAEKPPMACPQCGGTDFAIDANTIVDAYVHVNDQNEIEQYDSRSHGTEWDEDSGCTCRNCDYRATAGSFMSNQFTAAGAS